MAKSKTGGSRAYIRGRIGSDVYSIGRNAQGARQQVIRSLAEQVSNPRTQSQMFGRMIMSTVMQAVSALRPIIDHSFDGFPAGQPCISEFIRQNYALVKADAAAHPASGNSFDLAEYQEKGILKGNYVVSAGSAAVPAAVTFAVNQIEIELSASTLTVGGLKSALGLNAEGFLTWLAIDGKNNLKFFRANLSTTLADDTAISANNVASLFSLSGNVTPTVSLDTNTIKITAEITDVDASYGGIVSDKVDGSWVHSACQLRGSINLEQPADVALPTYPTGTEQFLNGGDL